VHFNSKHGSSALLTVLLMIILVAVAAFGFFIFVAKWDQRVAGVKNDSANLTGISYTSEMYNATNSTIHGLTNVMPNFIWILMIFFVVVFITLLAIGLRRN
jgi:hypothetical protein